MVNPCRTHTLVVPKIFFFCIGFASCLYFCLNNCFVVKRFANLPTWGKMWILLNCQSFTIFQILNIDIKSENFIKFMIRSIKRMHLNGTKKNKRIQFILILHHFIHKNNRLEIDWIYKIGNPLKLLPVLLKKLIIQIKEAFPKKFNILILACSRHFLTIAITKFIYVSCK